MMRVGAGQGEAVTTGRPRSRGWAVRGLLARSRPWNTPWRAAARVGPAFQDAALEARGVEPLRWGADSEVCAEPAGEPSTGSGRRGGRMEAAPGPQARFSEAKETDKGAGLGGGSTARPTRLPAKP